MAWRSFTMAPKAFASIYTVIKKTLDEPSAVCRNANNPENPKEIGRTFPEL